jgi:hypothetical protein
MMDVGQIGGENQTFDSLYCEQHEINSNFIITQKHL